MGEGDKEMEKELARAGDREGSLRKTGEMEYTGVIVHLVKCLLLTTERRVIAIRETIQGCLEAHESLCVTASAFCNSRA